MSCRETAGNSAVTSLSKFVTSADETQVASIFHRLRREGIDTLADDANTPADPDAVRAFLAECGHLARHDARVREARRQSLLDRLTAAEADLDAGNGPNKATFHAWTGLRDAIEQETSPIPDGAVITNDGLLVTQDEVLSARRAYEEALKGGYDPRQLMSTGSSALHPDRPLPDSNDPLTLAERYRRLERAYDSSDAGYTELLASTQASPDAAGHAEWRQRVQAADQARTVPSPIRSARIAAERVGLTQARAEFTAALRKARGEVQSAAGPKAALDQSVRESQAAHKVFAYALISTPELAGVMNADLRSPKAWQDIASAVPGITRNEIWHAIETCMNDRDLAEARMGRITGSRITLRNRARAEARRAAETSLLN